MNPDPLKALRDALASQPPALAAAGDWMLRNVAQAATLGIEDVARASGSSTASVNRMARAAGFEGFADLKSELARVLRDAIDPVQKLRDDKHHTKLSPPARYAAMAQANLEQFVRDNSGEALQAAAQLMLTKGHIHVLGLGLTSFLCGWLADALQPYVNAISFDAGIGGTERAAGRMGRIGRGDVLVAMSLPRYSEATVKLAGYARERGAKVLAIVDSHAAPLAAESDLSLFAPCAHPVLTSSYVAAQALCEALVAEVMRLNPSAVKVASDKTNALLSYWVPSPAAKR